MKLEDIFRALNAAQVKYLLIGGVAIILYGVPRTSIDIDVAISPSKANVKKTIDVLKKLGLTSDTEDVDDILAQGGITFSNEREVDILTRLPSKDSFETLWERRKKVTFKKVMINVVSKEDQIRLLKRVGRRQDLEDAAVLENR